jgi:gliding-associated putative ABC transporter substrate-binding component GldG
MSSSAYSRVSTAPVYVDINILQENLAPDKFNIQFVPIAYLLEGEFTSLFKNRFLPEGVDDSDFMEKGVNTGIVVIADGDLANNEFDPRNGSPLPVGYDPYMRQQFANADLIMNSIQYLLNGEGVISARAKQVIIRPLDKVKLESSKTYYKVLNIGAPLILILLIGFTISLSRKRRYTRF